MAASTRRCTSIRRSTTLDGKTCLVQGLCLQAASEKCHLGRFLETDLFIGDVLQIGTATLQVLQPRSPCYKLQIRFERPDMTALFFAKASRVWYASVLQEGTFSAGDEMRVVDRAPENVSVADIWQFSAQDDVAPESVARVMQLELLPDFWKSE